MRRAPNCPTCKRPAKPYPENAAHPFCCVRCKLADLSNWFSERYCVPTEQAGPSDDDPGPSGPPTLN